jgi:superfamily II DNA or RNA helicase
MTQLRPYQAEVDAEVHRRWAAGERNVVAVMPTGAGKSVLVAEAHGRESEPNIAIAHRQELVSQLALALARANVPHRIIAPDPIRRLCIEHQQRTLGYHRHDPSANAAVAGVDTLVRMPVGHPWLQRVKLWTIDEAHHLLADNKWGRAVGLMPNARGFGVTATLCRADGRGLGRHADGLFDSWVAGPRPRDLIRAGWLSEYRLFCPTCTDLDVSAVPVGASGDLSLAPLRAATHRAGRLVGDIVTHYLRLASGKRGVTFCVDVEAADEYAAAFVAAGIPALSVSAKTPDRQRQEAIRMLANGEVWQLTNCDLFGEGFDLPAIEVVSLARRTMSLGLSDQQIGRALRPGKPYATIIDHVGNTCTASGEMRHGTPDMPRVWSLDRRERRSRGDVVEGAIPLRVCPGCTGSYERVLVVCPYCGWVWTPTVRGGPETVDGDLHEVDPALLAKLRGEIERIDGPCHIPGHLAGPARMAVARNHLERQQAQVRLREAIAVWAGVWRDRGADDAESYRRFYLGFGVDVATAQTLGARPADELRERIDATVNNG